MDQRKAVVKPQHCQGPLLLERCFANKIQHQTPSSHDSRRTGDEEGEGERKRKVRSETGATVGSCIFCVGPSERVELGQSASSRLMGSVGSTVTKGTATDAIISSSCRYDVLDSSVLPRSCVSVARTLV